MIRGQVPEGIQVLGDGLDHVALLVDDHLVVRVAKATSGDRAAATVQREAKLLEVLAGTTPIRVPRPEFIDGPAGVFAYERLPGSALLEVLYGRIRHKAPPSSASVGPPLGLFLRRLHAVPWEIVDDLVEVDEVDLDEWRGEAADHLGAVRCELSQVEIQRIEAWLGQPPPPRGDALVLAHNDLGIEHVLVDRETLMVTGIIDWSDAALADPARDIGLLLRDLGPRAFTLVLAAYGPAEEDVAALGERALFYARCGALEDLAYGLQEGRRIYTRKSLASLSWLFDDGGSGVGR